MRSYGAGVNHEAVWGLPSAALSAATEACNHAPEFARSTYRFTVSEDASTGHPVGTVTATDPDDSDTVRYEITSGNEDDAFAVGESSGSITVAGDLDYETVPSHSLTVEAADGRGGAATTTVGIVVTNVVELPGRAQNLRTAQEGPWVRLEWEAPDDPTVSGYQVLRREPAIHAPGVFDAIVEDTGGTDTVYVDTMVVPETRYVYRVKAINADGVGPQSGYESITTGPPSSRQNPVSGPRDTSQGPHQDVRTTQLLLDSETRSL